MAEPFMSEIRLMSFGYAPKGWALCDGQTLPINQNQALFSLLGTTYGGNGQTTFQLPDLRGRVPIHMGGSAGTYHNLGEKAGEQAHTVSIAELPTHAHVHNATSAVQTAQYGASGLMLGKSQGSQAYTAASSLVAMDPSSLSNVGGSQAHLNMQPFLTLNFCIALQGIFPSQT